MQGGKGKIYFLRLITAVCLAGIIFVSISVWKEIKKKNEVQNEITKLQQEAEKISRENSSLKDKIAYLGSLDYKEKEAKDKLNMQNPEENVVIIKPGTAKVEDSQKNISDSVPKEIISETSNPKKWWDYFFKY